MMIRKLSTLIYKDTLLLVRDHAGLALLYLMPVALVCLMAYLQNDTFKTILENKMPLVVLNQDRDSVGNAIEQSLHRTGVFAISAAPRGMTAARLERAVAQGDYQVGVVIKAHTTSSLRQGIQQSIQHTFDPSTPIPVQHPIGVDIYVDPTTKNSFVSSLSSSMREYAAQVQTKFLLSEVSSQVQQLSPMPIGDISLPDHLITLNERYARLDSSRLIPNAVQHNVPAWGLFAIFFIVVSLAGNLIREREEGSFTRLRTMPCPYPLYLLSKVLVYLAICLTQLLLMGVMGVCVLPLLGLPALTLGHSYVGLLAVSVSASLAAIGYGLLIGQVARTDQQAAIFGSISVVILSALGGIWIPMFVMPHAMQIVCHLSPLNWGLTAYYNLLVRDGGLASVGPGCAALLLFGSLCFGAAVLYDRKKRIDI
jgi:ABC-2 type transport system permease protein